MMNRFSRIILRPRSFLPSRLLSTSRPQLDIIKPLEHAGKSQKPSFFTWNRILLTSSISCLLLVAKMFYNTPKAITEKSLVIEDILSEGDLIRAFDQLETEIRAATMDGRIDQRACVLYISLSMIYFKCGLDGHAIASLAIPLKYLAANIVSTPESEMMGAHALINDIMEKLKYLWPKTDHAVFTSLLERVFEVYWRRSAEALNDLSAMVSASYPTDPSLKHPSREAWSADQYASALKACQTPYEPPHQSFGMVSLLVSSEEKAIQLAEVDFVKHLKNGDLTAVPVNILIVAGIHLSSAYGIVNNTTSSVMLSEKILAYLDTISVNLPSSLFNIKEKVFCSALVDLKVFQFSLGMRNRSLYHQRKMLSANLASSLLKIGEIDRAKMWAERTLVFCDKDPSTGEADAVRCGTLLVLANVSANKGDLDARRKYLQIMRGVSAKREDLKNIYNDATRMLEETNEK